jgi:DNA invertase Pin-like site-specific DNA recombinase
MENVYLYIRYSHEKQEKGSSEDRQMDLARAYCPTLINDKEHIYFDKGKSAYKGEHLEDGGELKRFHDDVKSGKIRPGSTLLVEDLDRLSRADMWKASDFLRELTGAGITVVTLRDRKEYKGTLTVSDAITSLIKQELAHDESRKKGGRVAKSYLDRYAAARAGKRVQVLLPSWLEWVGEDVPYKEKEPEASTVRSIFTMAAKGWSYAMICKDLNQRGVPTFRGKPGALWITASVSAIIKGRAAIGEYAPNDGLPPIPGYFPAVVTLAEFDAAQGARALRKGTGVTSYNEAKFNVWSKVAVCARCKRPFHCVEKGRSAPQGREGYYYLVCSGKFGGKCDAKNIPAKRSEEAFVEVLMNVVNSDYFLGDKANELGEIRALTGQIDTLQVQKQRLDRVLTVSDDLEEVVAAIKRVKADIARLTTEKQAKEQALLEREAVERSRASILAKIDLVSRDGRIEANSLLKGLGVVVAIEGSVYIVRQSGKLILKVYQRAGREPLVTAYNEDAAWRMWERGETAEPEMDISLSEKMREREEHRKADNFTT